MRLLSVFSCLCICFASCSQNGSQIKDADKLVIFFNDGGILLTYTDSPTTMTSDFRKVLDGKTEKRRCPTTGEIRFFRQNTLLFETGFSISGGEAGCEYLFAGDKAWRLTYNTGMFLSETLAQLKKQ